MTVSRWGGDTGPSKSRLGPINLAGSQIVARPPNLAILLTHCGQLLLRKISKFDATRYQILNLKCTKFDFRWRCGAYRPLVVFKGAYF